MPHITATALLVAIVTGSAVLGARATCTVDPPGCTLMQYNSSSCDAASLTQSLYMRLYVDASNPGCYSEVLDVQEAVLASNSLTVVNSTHLEYNSYLGPEHCTGTPVVGPIVVSRSDACVTSFQPCSDMSVLGYPGVWQTLDAQFPVDEVSACAPPGPTPSPSTSGPTFPPTEPPTTLSPTTPTTFAPTTSPTSASCTLDPPGCTLMQYNSSSCDAASLKETVYMRLYVDASNPGCYSEVLTAAGALIVSNSLTVVNSTHLEYNSYLGPEHCTGTPVVGPIVVSRSDACVNSFQPCWDMSPLGYPGVWQTLDARFPVDEVSACAEPAGSGAVATSASGTAMVALSIASLVALL